MDQAEGDWEWARQENAIPKERREGSLARPRVLSGSVKIFYPSFKRSDLIKVLHDRIQELAEVLTLRRVVLFGSWVKARETAFSDIDLMVIYAGSHREDAYELVRKTLNLRGLEPHVYSEGEATHMKETLDRMNRQAIVLFPKG